MEVSFWQFLCKEGSGALPLKQRIPEVALFRGTDLEACYFSSQRGLLQRRSGAEASREALLDRLLALAARQTDKADLGTSTPVAILRRATGTRAGASPPQASVLSASEVLDLLERKGPGSRIQEFGPGAEWSLQSLAVPAEDLRVVAVYSRDPLGEERLDVVGRRYSGVYPLPEGGTWPAAVSSPGGSGAASAHAVVPPDQAAAAEAKTLALVRYVHRFHQRAIENLIAEFVVDSAGRVLLHGFWKASMFELGRGPSAPEGLPEEDSIAPTVRPSAVDAQSASSTATTAVMGCSGAMDAIGSRPASAHSSNVFIASQSMLVDSTEDGNDTTRRPSSAGYHESAASAAAAAAAAVEVVAEAAKDAAPPTVEASTAEAQADDSADRGCSTPSALETTARPVSDAQEHLDIQDDDGEGDEVEDEIARMEATARPQVVLAGAANDTLGGRRQQTPQQRAQPQQQRQGLQGQRRQSPRGGRPLSARSRPTAGSEPGTGGARSAVGHSQPGGGNVATHAATAPAPTTARPLSGRSRPSSAGSSLPTRPSSATTVSQQRSSRPNSARLARPAQPAPGARPNTARTRTSAGTAVSARARSRSAEQLQPPTPRSPRACLNTKQLISRYEHERTLRPRMTSTLGRQLERYRELVPAWTAQKQALQCAVKRKEQVAEQRRKEVEALVEERDQTERLYEQRYDALCRGLSHQRDEAAAQESAARQELERSKEEEEKTEKVLKEEDNRHANLKASLDQTVAQLDVVNENMQKCKDILNEWAEQPPADPAPELIQTMRQIEDTLKAREQIRSQSRTVRAEVMLAQDELQRQRGYNTRMEDFVRKVSSGGGRYILHPASKREGARLLAAASKLRAAAGLKALDEEEASSAR